MAGGYRDPHPCVLTVCGGGGRRGPAVLLPAELEVGLEILDLCLERTDVVFERFEVLLRAGLFCGLLPPSTLWGTNASKKTAHICVGDDDGRQKGVRHESTVDAPLKPDPPSHRDRTLEPCHRIYSSYMRGNEG